MERQPTRMNGWRVARNEKLFGKLSAGSDKQHARTAGRPSCFAGTPPSLCQGGMSHAKSTKLRLQADMPRKPHHAQRPSRCLRQGSPHVSPLRTLEGTFCCTAPVCCVTGCTSGSRRCRTRHSLIQASVTTASRPLYRTTAL